MIKQHLKTCNGGYNATAKQPFIMKIIEDIQQTPFKGLGKPEKLKHTLSGCWSRRIDKEHRIVYEVTDTSIRILACRYHY